MMVFIEGSIHAASSLNNLINDLLDMAKIEAAAFTLSFSEFNFLEAITEAFRILEYTAESKNIRLLLSVD
jgi:signal transduction histidine kinase